MLVGFDKPTSLFDLVELVSFVTELIGIKADIGTRESLKPKIKEQVLKEAILIPFFRKNE